MVYGHEVHDEQLVSAGGMTGPSAPHLAAVRGLYAQLGNRSAGGTLMMDLAEISGISPDLFANTHPDTPDDLRLRETLIEEPPVPLRRPYANFLEVNDEAARLQMVVSAYAPDPPKPELPKQSTAPDDTEVPAQTLVLAGSPAERIAELKQLQALGGLPETSSGIDVMARFQEAVAAEVPRMLFDMTYEGHIIGEAREEINKFQAFARLIVRRMIDPDGGRPEAENAYTTPPVIVAEQQVASRGIWKALTSRLKRLTASF